MYNAIFSRKAAKSLQRVPHNIADRIREKLAQIAEDPFAKHTDATKIQGRPGYRLRVGDWRVIYAIRQEELVIMVIKIASRGEVYR